MSALASRARRARRRRRGALREHVGARLPARLPLHPRSARGARRAARARADGDGDTRRPRPRSARALGRRVRGRARERRAARTSATRSTRSRARRSGSGSCWSACARRTGRRSSTPARARSASSCRALLRGHGVRARALPRGPGVGRADARAGGVRRRTTCRSWSRRRRSGWGSTSPTSGSCCSTTCRARSRTTCRWSAAPAATAQPSRLRALRRAARRRRPAPVRPRRRARRRTTLPHALPRAARRGGRRRSRASHARTALRRATTVACSSACSSRPASSGAASTPAARSRSSCSRRRRTRPSGSPSCSQRSERAGARARRPDRALRRVRRAAGRSRSPSTSARPAWRRAASCDRCAPAPRRRRRRVRRATLRACPEDVAGAILAAVAGLRWPLGVGGLVAMLSGSVAAPPSARRSPAFGAARGGARPPRSSAGSACCRVGPPRALRERRRLSRSCASARTDEPPPRIAAVPRRRPASPPASPADEALFERLRAWRRETAAATSAVPAFVVLSDRTLRALAAARPADEAELADVSGIGPAKLERYGAALLEADGGAAGARIALRAASRNDVRPRARRGASASSASSPRSSCSGCSARPRSRSGSSRRSRARSRRSTRRASGRSELNGVIYANDGTSVLAVLRGAESRVLVDSDEIAPVMMHAIVAIEDRRFWEHRGVDVRGIVRALWADVRQQRVVQGGSTITQQYVKNVYVREQAHDRPQGARGRARLAARAARLDEGADPHRVPEHDLLRERRVRDPAGGADLLRQGRARPDARRVRAARRASRPTRPAYDPVAQPGGGPRPPRSRCSTRCSRSGDITRGRARDARAPRCRCPEDVSAARHARSPGARRTSRTTSRQQLIERRGAAQRLRRRPARDDDDRPRAPGARARGDREVAAEPDGPQAALVALDPRHRQRARDGRRPQLPREPVQPRRPGRAPARLGVQAVRARDRARAGHLAGDDVRVEAARRSSSATRYVPISNYEDAYLGTADLETATVHSDNSVYTQLTQLVGPKRVAKTAATLGVHEQAQRLPLDRSRRRGGQPARARARVRRRSPTAAIRIDQRTTAKLANRPPRDRARSATADGEADRRATRRRRARCSRPRTAAIVNDTPPARGRGGHRHARRASALAGAPARPGRPRTTATRGSSATPRSSSSPSGSAIRRRYGRC